jgi:hypothetical protein
VKDSELVKDLSRDVRNQLKDINIACFVEKANTAPLNTVVSNFLVKIPSQFFVKPLSNISF